MNDTFTKQLAPAANVLPHFFFEVKDTKAKSPLVVMLLIEAAAVPVLVAVTFFAPFVTPTRDLPNDNEVGVRVMIGPPAPVTVSCNVV